MKPIDVLDWQAELINWWRSDVGVAFGHAFQDDRTQGPRKITGDLPMTAANMLDASESYWVSPDMSEMVYALAGRDDLPVHGYNPASLLSKYGFVVFDKPIYGPEVNGNITQIRAMQWGVQGSGDDSGVVVLAYTDTVYERQVLARKTHKSTTFEEVGDENVRQALDDYEGFPLPRLWLLDVTGLPFSNPELGIRRMTPEEALPPGLDILKAFPQGLAEPFIVKIGDRAFTAEDYQRINPNRLLRAFNLIAQQRVAGISGSHPNRAMMRRLRKFHFPSTIREVILRREVDRPYREGIDDDEPVLWSHRWIVRGFWRNQYYPSKDSHEPIWIDPYIKGPEGMPLVIKDTINKLVR